jgi:hypothetical protein
VQNVCEQRRTEIHAKVNTGVFGSQTGFDEAQQQFGDFQLDHRWDCILLD